MGDLTAGPTVKPATDAALLAQARELLEASPTGSDIMRELDADGVEIRFVDANPSSMFEAMARYVPEEEAILVTRGQVQDPGLLAVVLAHEGSHHLDMRGDGGAERVAIAHRDAAIGALTAPLRLENPLTGAVEGARRYTRDSERRAYETELEVAEEIGLVEEGEIDQDEYVEGYLGAYELPLGVRAQRDAMFAAEGLGVAVATGGAVSVARRSWSPVLKTAKVGGIVATGLVAHDLANHATKDNERLNSAINVGAAGATVSYLAPKAAAPVAAHFGHSLPRFVSFKGGIAATAVAIGVDQLIRTFTGD